MLHVVSLKRLTFTTSPLVQLVPVAPLESPLLRLEQVASIGQHSNNQWLNVFEIGAKSNIDGKNIFGLGAL